MSNRRMAGPAPLLAGRGRIVAIDVVRGFAILWVVLYHLWTDLRYPNVYPSQGDAFRAIPHRWAEGDIWGGMTSISDAFLRAGYLGVPLFMMLSGLSLTVAALRREPARASRPRALARRLRRVLMPYWCGFGLTLAFAAGLASVQWQRHGGETFSWYLLHGDINVDGGQLAAGALLVPRMVKDEWQFAPEGSLWFVLLIVQYYLAFPILLAALRRIGPWTFAAATLALTACALGAMIAADGDLLGHRSWVEMAAPFRLFEFGTGMTAGYLIVRRPQALLGVARAPVAAVCAAAGGALFVAGCMIDPDAGAAAAMQEPAIAGGLALVFVPFIARPPGALVSTAPARMLAWAGVISYTVLIVNEPLRSVTHTMSAERAPDGWMAVWVGVAYMPLTLVLARPLAVLLGLVERREAAVTVGSLIGETQASEGEVAAGAEA